MKTAKARTSFPSSVDSVRDNDIVASGAVLPAATILLRRHADPSMPLPQFTAAARERLLGHHWPSLAELDACIQRALILCEHGEIDVDHLVLDGDVDIEAERRATDTILRCLTAAHGERPAAAARLGISARTLRYKLADLRRRGFTVPVPAAAPLEFRYE